MPDGFPIAPQWISPILTAGLTATECLSASESAEIAPVRLHSCNVVSTPGIRWVRWGGRGDEMRLRGVVIRSPGTDQTLATGGGRPTSVHRHRSRVVWLRPDAGYFFSIVPPPHPPADLLVARRHYRTVRQASRLVDGEAGKQRKGTPQFQNSRVSERKIRTTVEFRPSGV